MDLTQYTQTMCRYGLNVCTVIINNNGISMGVEDLSGFEKPNNVPFFVYTPQGTTTARVP
jgi:thiamine pyrophosphate-dependent acetolactate synthase large subunit-like protein